MSYIYHFSQVEECSKRTDSNSYAAALYNTTCSLPLTPFVLKRYLKASKDQLIVLAFFFVPVFCIPDGK